MKPGGWRSIEDSLKLLPGDHFDIPQTASDEDATGSSPVTSTGEGSSSGYPVDGHMSLYKQCAYTSSVPIQAVRCCNRSAVGMSPPMRLIDSARTGCRGNAALSCVTLESLPSVQ
jgi:hypothetical protein